MDDVCSGKKAACAVNYSTFHLSDSQVATPEESEVQLSWKQNKGTYVYLKTAFLKNMTSNTSPHF